jgi:hypothetical protein
MAKQPNKPQPNGSPAAPMPAYFTSLSLENVRCFREKQTLDLSDGKGGPARWTILLGNNGTGKTTVLQALAIAAWQMIRDKETQPPFPYGFEPRTLQRSPAADASVVVDLAETRPGGLVPTGRTYSRAYQVRHHRGVDVSESSAKGDATLPGQLPSLCGYGAGRRLESFIEQSILDEPTGTLFSGLTELRDAEKWLLNLDHTASKPSGVQDRQRRRLEQVTELFLSLLPGVTGMRVTVEEAAFPKPRVEFQTPDGWVPLRSLGYGYQTLIAWMVDLASRMAERYPDSADPLAEPAIVLVDEIDLHLHPKWQRQLIDDLTKRFPNTQFIVTAHSPLVVQAAEGANLAVLRREGDQVIIDNNVDMIRNWRIDQIYTSELFGLPSARPPQLDELLKQRQAILAKPKLTAVDQSKLEQLDSQIGPLPEGETAEDAETRRLIRESLELLKKGAAKP